MKQFAVVEIEWIDSCCRDGWVGIDQFDYEDHEKAMYHHSVGYFLKKTDKSIFFCQSRQDNNGNMDNVFSIPLAAVKSVKEIKR